MWPGVEAENNFDQDVIKMTKTSGVTDKRIARKNPSRKQLDFLRELTNSHLNGLWIYAARLGENQICEQIEEVRFDRLQGERELGKRATERLLEKFDKYENEM